MISVGFRVEGPPVPWSRARISSRNGKITPFTPAKMRAYQNKIKAAAKEAMRGDPPMEGPIKVMVTVVLPIPKSFSKKRTELAKKEKILPTTRPDVDNYAKIAFDAMNGIFYLDDAQIVWFSCCKYYGASPSLTVCAWRGGINVI